MRRGIIVAVRDTHHDLPPVASDDELVEWGRQLNDTSDSSSLPPRPIRANRPLVAERKRGNVSTEEILLDISERAEASFERRRVIVRRSALAGKTSTS
jgi:hypothetical protein